MTPRLSRRRFIQSSLAAGVWTLGGFPALAQTPAAAPAPPPGFGVWLQFAADGMPTVLSNVAELGQGTHTAVAQIAAEELALPVHAIRVAQAPVAPAYVDRLIANYATYGSFGLVLSMATLRPVCASARDMLVRAAAQQWDVPPADCTVADGAVVHAASKRTLPYRALVAAAALLTPPAKPAPKPRKQWTVLGKATPRIDMPAKVDGSARFGIDVDRPGMLVATVLHAPTFGGRLLRVDDKPARAVRGVRKVVRLDNAVAVVADGYWPALKGRRALQPVWAPGPHASLDSAAYRQDLLAAVERGEGAAFDAREIPQTDVAKTAAALAGASRVVDARFDVPFLAHATMEPMNATAEVADGQASIWLSTQSALDTQKAVAKALGLAQDKVAVYPQLAGGGFGRRLENDFAVQAALVAQAVGKPVKLIWSRETDMRAGRYRPAAAARVRLALGPDHMPAALRVDLANASLLEYSGLTNGPPAPALDWTATMGWGGQKYAVPAVHVAWTRVDRGVPCGYWRSVGASQNVFFLECTLDQAARGAGIDPVEYRRRLFAADKRRQAFVDALAARAGWSQPLPAGHFRGIAVSQGNSALSGHVVELSVPAPGKFRLHRIVAAIDAGLVGNPDAVEAQLTSGTLFGLSAALFGKITLKDGVVEQGNFDGYRVVRMAELPPLDLLVVTDPENGRPQGVGEEGVASIAPAIANALFAATGKPVTRLPLSEDWEMLAPRG